MTVEELDADRHGIEWAFLVWCRNLARLVQRHTQHTLMFSGRGIYVVDVWGLSYNYCIICNWQSNKITELMSFFLVETGGASATTDSL
jgi:hypothetical protein